MQTNLKNESDFNSNFLKSHLFLCSAAPSAIATSVCRSLRWRAGGKSPKAGTGSLDRFFKSTFLGFSILFLGFFYVIFVFFSLVFFFRVFEALSFANFGFAFLGSFGVLLFLAIEILCFWKASPRIGDIPSI